MDERLELELEELESAEDFLGYFGIEYDPRVVQVNRLHILQRFHQYIGEIAAPPPGYEAQKALYGGLLNRAYRDFVASNALTEKVFRVFQLRQPRSVEVVFAGLAR